MDFFDLKKGLRALFLALDQTDSTFFSLLSKAQNMLRLSANLFR